MTTITPIDYLSPILSEEPELLHDTPTSKKSTRYIFRVPAPSERSPFKPVPPILTISEAHRQRLEVREIIQNHPERRLLQMLGVLNFYIYCTAANSSFGAITKINNQNSVTYSIDSQSLSQMLALSDAGLLSGTFPSTFATKYLKTFWGAGFCGRASFRGVREYFRTNLSLFDYQPGIQKTRNTPQITQINYKRMLIAYEAIEEELSARHQDQFGHTNLEAILPSHMGANVVALFNSTFIGFLKFRRNWRFDFGAVIQEDQMQHDQSLIPKATQLPMQQKFKSWAEIAADYRRKHHIAWNPFSGQFERYNLFPTSLIPNTA